MRSCTLNDYGLPNIIVYEDGRVYDVVREYEVGKPGDARALCYDHDGLVHPLTRNKLLGACFRAPWKNGIKCKQLGFMDLSRYYATEDGRVFGTRNMDYVQPSLTKDGYELVRLYTDSGDYMPWRVNRLIATAFIPNPENKDSVDHENGNRRDNHVSNLFWKWMWENYDNRRHRNGGTSDEKIREICRYLESGMTQTEAARAAHVDRYVVKDLQYGSYYHITKDFNIPRYEKQLRAPVEFKRGWRRMHGQHRRTHQILFKDSSSTTRA